MQRSDIVAGRTYASAGETVQRKVLDIGRHIRPASVAALQVPPDDPGVRYQHVGGHHQRLIEESYLTEFAAWADREIPEDRPVEPRPTWTGPRD